MLKNSGGTFEAMILLDQSYHSLLMYLSLEVHASYSGALEVWVLFLVGLCFVVYSTRGRRQ